MRFQWSKIGCKLRRFNPRCAMRKHVIFALFSLLLVQSEGRVFQEPVIDNGDYPDPGVILVDGVYYVGTSTNNLEPRKFPIHTSTDLQNWTQIGYVIDETNFPVWSNPAAPFWAADFHKIQDQYVFYFTGGDNRTLQQVIGTATSKNVAGPYTVQPEPLLSIPHIFVLDSTVIQHEDILMLAWVESQFIRVRNLTADGLGWKDDVVVPLFQPELPWEGGTVEGPWYVWRNGWHYMFYSGNGYCSEFYALGVARSRNPAGPYEKYPDALLVSNDKFKGPGHGSIVPDQVNGQWAFVHHAWKADHVCGDNNRFMFTTSMEWGDDDWPKPMSIGQ